MKHVLIFGAFVMGLSGLAGTTPAAAATRNFDCSKPGNANKTACKPAAHAAAPAATKVAAKAAPKPAAARAKPVAVAAKTERTYDCSKAGNKTKAQCKTTTVAMTRPAAKPVARPAVASAPRNYDCAKAGNANKQQCKGSARAVVAAAAPARRPAPRPAAAVRRPAAPAASSDNQVAAGAIARCKDGLYSHAARRDGACSRHGGVATWMKG